MRQDVIGSDQVRGVAIVQQAPGGIGIEKSNLCFHALFPGSCRAISGRVNAQNRNASIEEMLKKVAVIAGDFEHLRLWTQPKPLDHGVSVMIGVMDPAF